MATSPSEPGAGPPAQGAARAPLSPEMIAIAVAIAVTWPVPPTPVPPTSGGNRWRWEGHGAGGGVRATQAGQAADRWS